MPHLTTEQLEAEFAHVKESPSTDGLVKMIVRRPAPNEREILDEGVLDPAEGLVGDNWKDRPSSRTDDGGPHPGMQLTIVNSRILSLIAEGDRELMALAGDQIVADIDLGLANLPAFTRLSIGEAVIEISDQPHTGCAKFNERFGSDALRFVNGSAGREMRLRGVNAKVVTPGRVRVGDRIATL